MFARTVRQRIAVSSRKAWAAHYSGTSADIGSFSAVSSPVRAVGNLYPLTSKGDLRARIMGEIKVAMKNKDSFTSTTLRSVLSEVYNADKAAAEGKINTEKIAAILRKAFDRRSEAVVKFRAASREDLAGKEQKEMDIIAKFLPTLLSESDMDAILSPIVKDTPPTNPPQKALGMVFKEFYAQVDKSRVDAELLKSEHKPSWPPACPRHQPPS